MSGHPIFVRVDRNGVHRELMSSTEYADSDFLEMVGKNGIICVELVVKIVPRGLRQGSLSKAPHDQQTCVA